MKTFLICLFLACLTLALAKTGDWPYEAGRAVIKLKPECKAQMQLSSRSTGIPDVDRLISALGIESVKPRFQTSPKAVSEVDLSTILELKFDRGKEPIGVCNAFSRLTCVAYAEPIYIDEPFDAPNDYFFPYMNYLDSLYAEQAWAIHKGENGGQEVVIAIVDTGVNWKHPDLAENIWNNLGEDANANGYTIFHNGSAWVYDAGDLNNSDDDGNGKIDDLIGWNLMYDINGTEYYDPWVSSGHGTNVSGIANARTNNGIGVCSLPWNVKTMPIRCTPPGSGSIYRGYDGIIYAAENGADVINCSWGGIYPSLANQDAVNYAWSLGSVIIAASGNYNNLIPIYPSAYEKIVSVGTVRNSGAHTVCTYGPCLDVCAPMDSVYTATAANTYAYVGIATSYASPIACGTAALIKSFHPSWSNQQVVNLLLASSDDLNPYNPAKQNLLGYGRLNALQALGDTLIVPTPGLKLAIQEFRTPTESDGDLAVEAGEQISLNFRLRNFAWVSGADNLTLSLSCGDPDVSILDGIYSCAIGPDAGLEVSDAFLVQLSPSTQSKYLTFTISCSAEVPLLNGSSLRCDVLVNGPGIYIWEGFPNGAYMSGTYLRDTLTAAGYRCTLGNNYNVNGTSFPASLQGFDAVFLSYGAVGSYYYVYAFVDPGMFDAVRDYLEGGGRLYIEGSDAIGYDIANYFPEHEPGLDGDDIMYPLLGLASADDGGANTISLLSGANGWHTQGIEFTASTQGANYCLSQDRYVPGANGLDAFTEDGYGTVAVQSLGSHGQRAFLMSYTLKCLTDSGFPNTRGELVNRILDFFFDPELQLPDVTGLAITQAGADSVRLSWEFPFGVDYFKILSGDSPENLIWEGLQATNKEAVIQSQARRFFQVIAHREFGW